MRFKKKLKETTNSQVYKKVIHELFGCPRCPPNKGCNKNRHTDFRNWKNHRGHQWKS